jgi:hypothetical protein
VGLNRTVKWREKKSFNYWCVPYTGTERYPLTRAVKPTNTFDTSINLHYTQPFLVGEDRGETHVTHLYHTAVSAKRVPDEYLLPSAILNSNISDKGSKCLQPDLISYCVSHFPTLQGQDTYTENIILCLASADIATHF